MSPKKIEDLPEDKLNKLSVKELRVLRFIYYNKVVSYADLHDKDSSFIGALGKLFTSNLVDIGFLDDGTKCICSLDIIEDTCAIPKQKSLISYDLMSGGIICAYCGMSCISDYGKSYLTYKEEKVWVCKMCVDFDPGMAKVAAKLNIAWAKPLSTEITPTKTKITTYKPLNVWETEEVKEKPLGSLAVNNVKNFFRCSKCEILVENKQPNVFNGNRYCDACIEEIKKLWEPVALKSSIT